MPRGVRGSSSSELTGGSGDVNPQYLASFVIQTGADVTTQATINLPIPRLPVRPGKALVIEALWVDWFRTTGGQAVASTQLLGALSTSSVIFANSTGALQDPKLISATFHNEVAVGAAFAIKHLGRDEDVLTDSAGHGVLIATDKLYLTCYSANTGTANEVVARMGYRFKEIGLSEYVGIVQSQQ